MKSFPTTFAADQTAPAGAAPVWILKITVATVDYYLSDNVFPVAGWNGGITTQAWVQSWGQVRESISGALGEIRVAEFSLALLADLDASPNAIDLALADTLEKSAATLYLWFRGLDAATDPPQAIFSGFVADCEIPDESTVNLTIEDGSSRLQHPAGRVINATTYPGCDPDDIGKIVPIVYGTVKGLPAPALKAGGLTTLKGALTAVATSIDVIDPDRIVIPSTMRIDTEQVRVTAKTGATLTIARGYGGTTAATHVDGSVIAETGLGIKTTLSVAMTNVQTTINLTSVAGVAAALPVTVLCGTEQIRITAGSANPWTCTRGYAGTAAAAHAISSAVAEVTGAPFVFAVNDGEVSAIDRVRCRAGAGLDVDVTDLVTRYLGGVATSYTGFDNLAAVTVTAAQAASILARMMAIGGIIDPGHLHSKALEVVAVELQDYNNVGVGVPLFPELPLDGNFNSGAVFSPGNETNYFRILPPNINGTAVRMRLCVQCGGDGKTGRLDATLSLFGSADVNLLSSGSGTVVEVLRTNWIAISSATKIYATDTLAKIKVWFNSTTSVRLWEIWYEIESDPSTSNITTGIATNSVADTALGGRIIVDVTRGITQPDLVIADLLGRYGGGMSCTLSGAWPAGHRVDGALLAQADLLATCARIAFEHRSWFRVVAGAAVVRVRPDTLTSAATLAACRIDAGRKIYRRNKAALDDVLNKIVLRYGRDYDVSEGDDAYLQLLTVEDATSQADYGLRERPELYRCNWITDATWAAAVAAFYLATYKRRRWRHEFEVFLDQVALEFGDQITLGFADSIVGEVTEAGISPGSIDTIDTISIVVEA